MSEPFVSLFVSSKSAYSLTQFRIRCKDTKKSGFKKMAMFLCCRFIE